MHRVLNRVTPYLEPSPISPGFPFSDLIHCMGMLAHAMIECVQISFSSNFFPNIILTLHIRVHTHTRTHMHTHTSQYTLQMIVARRLLTAVRKIFDCYSVFEFLYLGIVSVFCLPSSFFGNIYIWGPHAS